jgi:aminopeptidase N
MGSRRAVCVLAFLAACGRDADRRPVTPIAEPGARDGGGDPRAAASNTPGEVIEGLWFPATDSIAARVRVLADAALRGRGSTTRDEVAAADKMAAWFRAAGLEPGGADGGWLQPFEVFDDRRSQNVVGFVRGTDPRAGHIVVGAHYDHLGVDENGAIHPGADDNASGAAALIAIAEALTHDGQRPARTIVFVAFGAEEIGLFGSAYYVEHPLRPLSECALMINLDMVGRARFLSAEAYSAAHLLVPPDGIGALTSPEGRDLALLAKAAGALEHRPVVAASDYGPIEALIRPAVEYRGDHKSFADRGVRYLWLSTSMHDDYHLPSDTADKVDPPTIATVGRIVVRVIQTIPLP